MIIQQRWREYNLVKLRQSLIDLDVLALQCQPSNQVVKYRGTGVVVYTS